MASRTLICVSTYPGHEYCREEWIKNTVALAGSKWDVFLLWNGGGNPRKIFPKNWKIETIKQREGERAIDLLERKHNRIRQYFLNKSYDYMFMLESDNFPPAGTIEKFMAHDKDMVTAVYFMDGETKFTVTIQDIEKNRQDPVMCQFIGQTMYVLKRDYQPSIWGIENGESRLWRIEDCFPQRGLVRILSAGVGSVLIKREPLEQTKFRITGKDGSEQFTDFHFYWDSYQKGFKAYVDTDVIANHIHPKDDLGAQDKWFSSDTLKQTRISKEDFGGIHA